VTSALCQPIAPLSETASGENRNCERAGRGAGAEGKRAHIFRQELSERPEHDRERAAGEAEADEHAGSEVEHFRRCGVGHQGEPGSAEHRAYAQHFDGAEAVGNRARERLADAPQQHLQRERKGVDVPAP
jgi:hypothetical protein